MGWTNTSNQSRNRKGASLKTIKNGIAVLGEDTHISKWVTDAKTIEIAEPMLLPFKQYIPDGGCVVDVGASIGDHTVTYAKWVGPTGMVMAFEPYKWAYECLVYNTRNYQQVVPVSEALSDKEATTEMVILDNAGASYTTDKPGKTTTSTLDSFELERVDFLKIDAEGAETKILLGSARTIAMCRPVMLIEVNRGALERAKSSADELKTLIASMGYNMKITDHRINWSDPQFDIICLPIEKPTNNA